MTRTDKGAKHQAKHDQPDDRAHAVHQEQAEHGAAQQPSHRTNAGGKGRTAEHRHRVDPTPKGPRKGQ